MKFKSIRRFLGVALSIGVLLLLSGCGQQSGTGTSSQASGGTSATSSQEEESASQTESQTESSDPTPSWEEAEETGQTALLYIGTEDNFQQVEVPYSGTLTPAFLVDAIAQETGWNLDLADEITQGKGGMTVDFASTSALVVGPPETQKEAYFVQDQGQLTETILDSIAYTFQQNFVDPQLGDPSSLDVYFSLNGGDIEINGTTLDYTQPYEIGD